MRKHLIFYPIILLPALLAYYILPAGNAIADIAQWVIALLMLLGWGIVTAVIAYGSPRFALALLLAYFGVCTLLIYGVSEASLGTPAYAVFDFAAGALTYRPLNMFYQTLREFNVFGEMWVLVIIVGFCTAGLLSGMIYRRMRPNPYRPTFTGR